MALQPYPRLCLTHIAQRGRVPALLLLRALLGLAVAVRPATITIRTIAVRATAPDIFGIEDDDGPDLLMKTAAFRVTGLSRPKGGGLAVDGLAGLTEEGE